jgi:hypothetical protein
MIAGRVGLVAAPSAIGMAFPGIASGTAATLSFTDYGKCDGATDDGAAFAKALSDLNAAGGGTLLLPPKSIAITMSATPTFDIPANVRIVGTRGATTILLSSTNEAAYVAFAGSAGDNVTFDGIKFVRNSNCTMMFFYPAGYDGFHLRHCVIDGQRATFANTVHGFVLNRAGTKKNITLNNCVLTGTDYGLLQANHITDDVDTIVVDQCTFTGNYADDLEFNAPNSNMTNVTVSNCRFTNNLGTSTTASLGVGMAHVVNGVVRDCHFENYFSDAIHLEDYCENVVISGNQIITCATNPSTTTLTDRERGGITVNHGCSGVVITGNALDHTANQNSLHGIVVKNLSGETTAGGRPAIEPRRITITDNIIRCGGSYQGMWIVMVDDLVVRGNTVVGSGTVEGGIWDRGNEGYGIKISGGSSAIEANVVSGFRYGLSGPFISVNDDVMNPPWSARRALGNPGNVTGNLMRNCYIGVVAVPSGALTISGNTMFNCVRPMIAGENEYTAEPCAITGNFAMGCTYPMEIGGKQVVVRSSGGSTAPVGGARTINVDDTFLTMPIDTVISFSGGGMLTLTTPVTVSRPYVAGSPYALVGTVSETDIEAGEYGIATGLVHSTTAENNRVAISANTDTAAGR